MINAWEITNTRNLCDENSKAVWDIFNKTAEYLLFQCLVQNWIIASMFSAQAFWLIPAKPFLANDREEDISTQYLLPLRFYLIWFCYCTNVFKCTSISKGIALKSLFPLTFQKFIQILSKESLVYLADFQLVKIITSERFSWIHVTHQVTHVDNTEKEDFLKGETHIADSSLV